MNQSVLTSEAKEALRKGVRALRAQLIDHLLDRVRAEYRLDVAADEAKLPEARRRRRERLEGWIAEELRSAANAKAKRTYDALLLDAVKEAAYTLLNRIVLLRILEHHDRVSPKVVTGGWRSPAYEQEFAHYAGPLAQDDARGYRDLLDAVFAELALELPGLYGPVGLTALVPVPVEALRPTIELVNDPALEPAWGDDTTLGWVYQYWNDPDREALDEKINKKQKIEPHEIAQKTQMFTERYMVEWLLENSLGLTWLCICKKNGWTADAEAVLPVLDARRAEWRKRREAGEVAADALMPFDANGVEGAWKYFVPQPIPEDAIEKAPSSIREVKLLDPACGSGHFLVIAFGLLARMYEEEARHRGETWTREAIAEGILANNLHGIDIDPRAIQIAAAALWLRAKLHAPEAKLARMNLVAPSFRLASLPKDDPALQALYAELEALGVSRETTATLVEALRGVGHLGTLLKIDRAIAELVDKTTSDVGPLFGHAAAKQRAALEAKIAQFLDAHAAERDLGLRLEAEQLAAGVRFVQLAKENTYDVVAGNPPYQGLTKTSQFEYVVTTYPRGKDNLYAAFLERGLELVREGGLSALLTMRGWMFLGKGELRKQLLKQFDLRALVDLDSGAFEEVSAAQVVLSVSASVFRRGPKQARSVALRPTPVEDRASSGMAARKRAGLLAQVGRHEFDPRAFAVIDGEPILYWWREEDLQLYGQYPLLGSAFLVAAGVKTGGDVRFVRLWFEVHRRRVPPVGPVGDASRPWQFYIKGAEGAEWVEPAEQVLSWARSGLELGVFGMYQAPGTVRLRDPALYFRLGIAFSPIGASFSARAHRFPSIFGNMGSSVFSNDTASTLCTMNTSRARRIVQALNPGLHFENDDVKRLPLFPVQQSTEINGTVERAFGTHESRREASVEFRGPGASAWAYTQDWAQRAVDRPEEAPLPPYEPTYDEPEPEAFLSFAFGVALGRFGASGEGILDDAPGSALRNGILFVGPDESSADSLADPAAAPILAAWEEHRAAIVKGKKTSLREWLRKDFFAHHKKVYDSRPIYFPLSSEKKSFVAWVSIHRWTDDTLKALLAFHLGPTLAELERAIKELSPSRASPDKKIAAEAEKRFGPLARLRDELADFIAKVTECAERGAPPTDAQCPPRTDDATFHMDLDDGVMINSAALWPLLAPQWSDPKKWWKQLCVASDDKDYDWSHLARRYFRKRVDDKCVDDPSLAVAHGCFWRLHPAKAYAWELRLQDEIRPDFTIDEEGSSEARIAFLQDHPIEAMQIREKELQRRARKAAKAEREEEKEDVDEAEDAGDDATEVGSEEAAS